MNQYYRASVIDDIATAAWWRGFLFGMVTSALSLACWVALFRGLHWAWGA